MQKNCRLIAALFGLLSLAKQSKINTPGIKIQLASGFANDEENRHLVNELSDNLLQKPFNAEFLLQKIRLLLA